MKKGLLNKGYRLYIGEWSAGLQVARNCNNPTKLPNPKQSTSDVESTEVVISEPVPSVQRAGSRRTILLLG